MSDLQSLLHRLVHAGVEFVIVGGYAGIVHGCTQASERFEVEGAQFHVLSIDALITAKKAMNRPRDREAIRQLQNVRRLRRQKPLQ